MEVLEKILLKKIFIAVSFFLSTSGIIAYGIVKIWWKYSNSIFVVAWIIIFIIILACRWLLFVKSDVIDGKSRERLEYFKNISKQKKERSERK